MNDKQVIVTGGANGIGRCIAESFLKTGAGVTIIDIDDSAIEGVRCFCGDDFIPVQ